MVKGIEKPNTYFAEKKSVMNMIWLLFPIFDLSIVRIGSGGLLLVVSHLYAVWLFVLWVELEKKVNN